MNNMGYMKSVGNEGYIKGLEVLAFDNATGTNLFQPALYKTVEGKYYLYWSTFGGLGITIYDITDPTNPKHLKKFLPVDPTEYPSTRSPKVQVADGLMIVALSSGGGPKVLNIDRENGTKKIGGIRIFDIKSNPENPKFLGEWDNGVPDGYGVHRFCYEGGRYVHLSSDAPGFYCMIYRIIDIIDPTHPVEVGKWWLYNQYVDGRTDLDFDPTEPHSEEILNRDHLHGPPYVVGNKAYMGCGGAGLCIVDIEDITRPRLLGKLPFRPLFGGGLSGARCHTAVPFENRGIAIVSNEGERFAWFDPSKMTGVAQPMNNLHVVDIRDPQNPVLIAEFPYPEVPEGFPYPNFNECGLGHQGPFGPHNIHEPMPGKEGIEHRDDVIYCCYFHAGLRIYDISDKYYIKETAYFIPPFPEERRFKQYKGPSLATTEDIVVDDRGYIYMNAMEDGMYILKRTK